MRAARDLAHPSKIFAVLCAVLLSGCAVLGIGGHAKQAPLPATRATNYDYIIGPGDSLNIFVWRNPDVSTTATVRPDGKISVPLVEDLQAAGKTSTQLAREIEQVLSKYIRDPLVTVMVGGFQGMYDQQVRVVGEAAKPQALPYKTGMTMLDVMISVGGLTEFADGNDAHLVRMVDGKEREMTVRLDDLLKDGDISANVQVAPGDIIIIPEAWF